MVGIESSSRATVIVADSDALLRDLLDVVCTEHGIAVVGSAETTTQLVDLCVQARPDLVLSDVDLADGLLEDVLEAVLATGARVLVLSDDVSPEPLTRLLERGASGYLLLDTTPAQLAEALVAVAEGLMPLHPSVAGTIVEQWRRLRAQGDGGATQSALTPREHEVLTAMAEGLATKAIAVRLGMARKTVENHKLRIFDKLGVRTHAHAVSIAIGHGLLAGRG